MAEYLTKLPELGVLEEKLRLSIVRARRRLEAAEEERRGRAAGGKDDAEAL